MSYRHRKGRHKQRPVFVADTEGGLWKLPGKKRAPIRVYADGYVEDDLLPRHFRRTRFQLGYVRYVLHLLRNAK